MQAVYDAYAPVLRGSTEFSEHMSPCQESVTHTLFERSHIARALFCDKLTFTFQDRHARKLEIVNDLISLCALRERHARGTYRKRSRRDPSMIETTSHQKSSTASLSLKVASLRRSDQMESRCNASPCNISSVLGFQVCRFISDSGSTKASSS